MVGYLAMAVGAWLLVSLLLFLVSAQIQSAKVSDAAEAKLSGGGYPLTSPNTILVLGSDARAKGKGEPGAQTIGSGPSRSDSMLLLRVGGGANAQLSILRDTVVDIPGHGRNKINAAYAFGGPSLAIQTVESYLGIDINHLVEVNFENFPDLIDALGGITYTGNCVISKINGGSRNGGTTLRLKAGTNKLNGDEALIARAHAAQRLPPERERPGARDPPAEDPQRDQGQGHVVRDLHPAPVGVVGGAEGGALGHVRPDAARADRRRADRRQLEEGRARAVRRRDAARRRRRPHGRATPTSSARSSSS